MMRKFHVFSNNDNVRVTHTYDVNAVSDATMYLNWATNHEGPLKDADPRLINAIDVLIDFAHIHGYVIPVTFAPLHWDEGMRETHYNPVIKGLCTKLACLICKHKGLGGRQ
jgi:hypothetical protein